MIAVSVETVARPFKHPTPAASAEAITGREAGFAPTAERRWNPESQLVLRAPSLSKRKLAEVALSLGRVF